MPPDLDFVRVDARILSSYSDKPLSGFEEAGFAPRDVADALLALCLELPWLRVTELRRTVATQARARAKYERWLAAKAAGEPFDSKTMKRDFVAKPGKSMHNAGRAVDLWTEPMRQALGAEYLDVFWPVAARHGFTPVLAKPTEGRSEEWHFDHAGPWGNVRAHHGYEAMALCAALIAGEAGEWQSDARLAQALLLRQGLDIGEPDGAIGKRTRAALLRTGVYPGANPSTLAVIEAIPALRALPPATTWERVG